MSGRSYETSSAYNNKYVPMNAKRRQKLEMLAGQKKNNTNMLYKLAQDRERRKQEKPHLYASNPYSVEHISDPFGEESGTSVWDQLKSYRQKMKEKNMYRVPKEITIKDLEKMNQDERMPLDPNDIKRHGIRCLELTNNFRKMQGLPALIWNDELYRIGMEHSQNMAEGKVPFGHDGFQDRMRKVTFYVRSFSENVAYNHNVGDP